MTERWKDIPGYEGRYQVSDLGRVRSLDRRVRTVSRFGTEGTRMLRGRILRPQRHSQGYAQVGLSKKLTLVHLLVLRAFVGPAPPGKEVAHWNGRKTHNVLSNLRYVTPLENANDRRRHNTSGAGEKNAQAKLTAADVIAICKLRPSLLQKEIAARFGIAQSHVSRIVRGARWRA